MSNSKQMVHAKTRPTSLPQFSTTQRRYNYNMQQCEVRLVRDPLLIPKQDQPSSSHITLNAIRQSAAEVFIEAISPSTDIVRREFDNNNIQPQVSATYVERTGQKEMHNLSNETDGIQDTSSVLFNKLFDGDGDDEQCVVGENAGKRAGEKENNNNANSLQEKYRCGICDDVCTDKLEFTQHLEFHLELHEYKNKKTVNTEVVTVDKSLSPSKTNNVMTDATQALQTAQTDATHNSNKGYVTETAAFDNDNSCENRQTSKPSELVENISTATLLRRGRNTTTNIARVEISSSSVSKIAAKRRSNKSARKKETPGLPSTNERDILDALKTNKQLPKIPIRKCDCRLKKLETKCEFCRERPKYVCGNCKKEFTAYLKLKEHVADAHKSAKYFCQECGQGYSKTTSLKRHVDRHKGLFACSVCTSSFKIKEEFEEHRTTHRLKCDQCDKVCASKKELSLHKLEVHKGVTYTCRDCNKTFNKCSILNSHSQRHHRTGEYTCKECGKVYNRLASYRRHIHRHNQQMQVICEECGKEFGSVLYLKVHQKAIHLKKKYICNVCKKEFSTTMARNDCQNKHAGIAKYKCDMCEKAFYYYASLVIHKRIHTGEKPYICFVCSRRFYSRQMLFKHCLSHGIPEKEVKQRLKVAYQPEGQNRFEVSSN